MKIEIPKDRQYYKFCWYGFFKNLRFFEAFLLLFFLSKGLDYWQIGLIYSLREVTRNVLEIPSGIISDGLGRRSSLAISFMLYIVSYLSFYFSQNFVLILLAMFLYAVGDAFRSGTHKAMIYSYLEQKGLKHYKTAYYGNTRSCSQIGSAVCSLIGGGFVWFSGSYTSIFLFSVIPAFLDMILVLSYPKNLEGRLKSSDKNALEALKMSFLLLWQQMKQLTFWYHTNLVALHTAYYKTIKDYLQPIIAGLALSIPFSLGKGVTQREALWVGFIYFIIYLLTGFSSRKSGVVDKKINNPLLALNMTLFLGLGLGILGGVLAWQNYIVLSLMALIGVFMIENLRKPIGVSVLADTTLSETWASVLSFQNQMVSLYAALMAPLLGLLADFWGVELALVLISLITLVFSLITHFLHK